MNMFALEFKQRAEETLKYLEYLNEDEKIDALNWLKQKSAEYSPLREPVDVVQWVPADQVVANEYNPNKVAPPEMRLLHLSIKEDGYTQPIVCYYDKEQEKYIVVDGFHRNRVGKEKRDIRERIRGRLPVVVIDKPIEDRMASTIRHNRARGKHAVSPMSELVAILYRRGWDDGKIAKELGMEIDEVLRLKQVTGLPDIFKEHEYSRAWE